MSADASESLTSRDEQSGGLAQSSAPPGPSSLLQRLVVRPPRWIKTRTSVVAGGIALAVLVGLTVWAASGSSVVMRGSMTVSGGTMPQVGPTAVGVCTTMRGYFDVRAGTAVTVRDSSSEIVAVGQLGPATEGGYGSCTFPFAVEGVPRSDFYTVEVGRRGEVSVTAADAASGNVRLSLGGY